MDTFRHTFKVVVKKGAAEQNPPQTQLTVASGDANLLIQESGLPKGSSLGNKPKDGKVRYRLHLMVESPTKVDDKGKKKLYPIVMADTHAIWVQHSDGPGRALLQWIYDNGGGKLTVVGKVTPELVEGKGKGGKSSQPLTQVKPMEDCPF